MHGEPAQVYAAAFDHLLAVEQETVAVEEGPGSKADVGRDLGDTNSAQRRLNTTVKSAGDTATSECGMNEEKVQVAVEGVGSEACERSV